MTRNTAAINTFLLALELEASEGGTAMDTQVIAITRDIGVRLHAGNPRAVVDVLREKTERMMQAVVAEDNALVDALAPAIVLVRSVLDLAPQAVA